MARRHRRRVAGQWRFPGGSICLIPGGASIKAGNVWIKGRRGGVVDGLGGIAWEQAALLANRRAELANSRRSAVPHRQNPSPNRRKAPPSGGAQPHHRARRRACRD
jgi:hypothetical protein